MVRKKVTIGKVPSPDSASFSRRPKDFRLRALRRDMMEDTAGTFGRLRAGDPGPP